MDERAGPRMEGDVMSCTPSPQAPFLYVETDVPAGQTLVAWRRERNLEQAARRHPARRALRRLAHHRHAA
jgi:hypothetical protein